VKRQTSPQFGKCIRQINASICPYSSENSDNEASGETGLEWQRYWSVMKRKGWMVALAAIVGSAAAGYYSTQLVRPQYEASAKLIVHQSRPAAAQGAGIDVGMISSNILLIKTYKEIIRTPRIMDEVVRRHPELRASANELTAIVGVRSVNESQVMSIVVRDDSYERAAAIANAVSEVFRQEIRVLMNVDNVSILNLADPAERHSPVAPNPMTNVMVAFVLCAMAGIGLAFVLDQLDDKIRTEADVRERLGIPLLAEIPAGKPRDRASGGTPARQSIPMGENRNVTIDA